MNEESGMLERVIDSMDMGPFTATKLVYLLAKSELMICHLSG